MLEGQRSWILMSVEDHTNHRQPPQQIRHPYQQEARVGRPKAKAFPQEFPTVTLPNRNMLALLWGVCGGEGQSSPLQTHPQACPLVDSTFKQNKPT